LKAFRAGKCDDDCEVWIKAAYVLDYCISCFLSFNIVSESIACPKSSTISSKFASQSYVTYKENENLIRFFSTIVQKAEKR